MAFGFFLDEEAGVTQTQEPFDPGETFDPPQPPVDDDPLAGFSGFRFNDEFGVEQTPVVQRDRTVNLQPTGQEAEPTFEETLPPQVLQSAVSLWEPYVQYEMRTRGWRDVGDEWVSPNPDTSEITYEEVMTNIRQNWVDNIVRPTLETYQVEQGLQRMWQAEADSIERSQALAVPVGKGAVAQAKRRTLGAEETERQAQLADKEAKTHSPFYGLLAILGAPTLGVYGGISPLTRIPEFNLAKASKGSILEPFFAGAEAVGIDTTISSERLERLSESAGEWGHAALDPVGLGPVGEFVAQALIPITALDFGVELIPAVGILGGVTSRAIRRGPQGTRQLGSSLTRIGGREGAEVAARATTEQVAAGLTSDRVRAGVAGATEIEESLQAASRRVVSRADDVVRTAADLPAGETRILYHGFLEGDRASIDANGLRVDSWLSDSPETALRVAKSQSHVRGSVARMAGRSTAEFEPAVLAFEVSPGGVRQVAAELEHMLGRKVFQANVELKPRKLSAQSIGEQVGKETIDPPPPGSQRYLVGIAGDSATIPQGTVLSSTLADAEMYARAAAHATGQSPRVMIVDVAGGSIDDVGGGVAKLADGTAVAKGEMPLGIRGLLGDERGAVRLPGKAEPVGPKDGPIYAPGDPDDVLRLNTALETPPKGLGRLAPGAIVRFLDEIPYLRYFSEWLAPEKVTNVAGRAFRLADVFRKAEKNRVDLMIASWRGRNQDILGLTADGRATKVVARAGVNIQENAYQRLDDIVERSFQPEGAQRRLGDEFRADYELTDIQRRAVQELRDTFEVTRAAQIRAGIPIKRADVDYWRRVVLSDRPRIAFGTRELGRRMGAELNRSFDTVRDALDANLELMNPIESLTERMHSGIDGIAEQYTIRQLRKAGAEGAEDIADLHRLFNEGLIPPEWKGEMSRYMSTLKPSMINEALALVRIPKIVGDISQMFVQGINLFFRDNPAWWRTSGYAMYSLGKMPYEWFARNTELLEKMTRFNVGAAPEEMLARKVTGETVVGRAARGLGRLPVVKQTQRSFEMFSLIGQAERWRVLESVWTRRLGRELVDEEFKELASIVRKEMGTIQRAGQTSTEKVIDSLAMFAPRFVGSFTGMMVDAVKPGLAGHEARVQIGSVLAGSTALVFAGNAAQGEMPNLTDPFDPSWMGVRTGDGWLYPMGPWHTWARAVARGTLAAQDGDMNKLLEAAADIGRGKLSLGSSAAIDLFLGEDFAGRKVENNPRAIGSYLLQRFAPIPIGFQQALEPILPRSVGGGPTGTPGFSEFPGRFAELAGLRTSPETPAHKRGRFEDKVSLATYGVQVSDRDKLREQRPRDWAQILDHVQGVVEGENPGIYDLAEQRARETNPRLDAFKTLEDDVEAALKGKLQQAEEAHRAGTLTRSYPDLRRDAIAESRHKREQNRKAFPDLDRDHEFFDLVDRYYDETEKHFPDGAFDFEGTDAARSRFINQLPDADQERLNSYLQPNLEEVGRYDWAYKQYLDRRTNLGYYDEGVTQDHRDELDRENPDLEFGTWYWFGGVAGQPNKRLSSTEAVDLALRALDSEAVQNREVKWDRLSRPINQSVNSRTAWARSQDVVDYYYYGLRDDIANIEAAKVGIAYADLNDAQRDEFKEVFANQIGAGVSNMLDAAPDWNAWLVWWGYNIKVHTSEALVMLDSLYKRYGDDPIITNEDTGEKYQVELTQQLQRSLR